MQDWRQSATCSAVLGEVDWVGQKQKFVSEEVGETDGIPDLVGVLVWLGASPVFDGVLVWLGGSGVFDGVLVWLGGSGVFDGVLVWLGGSPVLVGVLVSLAGSPDFDGVEDRDAKQGEHESLAAEDDSIRIKTITDNTKVKRIAFIFCFLYIYEKKFLIELKLMKR